jgi:signal transduction histidine kinase
VTPSIPDRLAGALADRYRLERELGQGGMATVYLAEDLKHGRKVAVKVLKPELAAVLGADRFVVEIRTTAALQHPNILPLFDSGECDRFLYYVMPFIQGETLRAKLDRTTRQIAWIELLPGPDSPGVTVIASSQVEVPSELDEEQRALTSAACSSGQLKRGSGQGSAARSAAVPLTSEGVVVGALGVTYLDEAIPADEYRVLEAIGAQLGTALSNIRHHASTREGLAALSIANKNLKIYIELATEAQEEERKRLSRELHDDTMQALVLTLAQIDIATTQDLPEVARARLAAAQGTLTETLDNLRRFCRDLRPSLIDDLGLVDAVDWLVSDLRSRAGMVVTLEVHGPRTRLSSRDELLVFRIVQESLHNVERHAQATRVQVSFHFGVDQLVVEVVDDGRGSAAIGRLDHKAHDRGLGLRGMDERAKLLRGELVVESAPGHGTAVRICVPTGSERAVTSPALPRW